MPTVLAPISFDTETHDGVFNLVGEIVVDVLVLGGSPQDIVIHEVDALEIHPSDPWMDGTSDPIDLSHMTPQSLTQLLVNQIDGDIFGFLLERMNEQEVVDRAYNPAPKKMTPRTLKALDAIDE